MSTGLFLPLIRAGESDPAQTLPPTCLPAESGKIWTGGADQPGAQRRNFQLYLIRLIRPIRLISPIRLVDDQTEERRTKPNIFRVRPREIPRTSALVVRFRSAPYKLS